MRPENPKNFPRNLFVWRSNILGSSGKGHEYFLKYLLENALDSETPVAARCAVTLTENVEVVTTL